MTGIVPLERVLRFVGVAPRPMRRRLQRFVATLMCASVAGVVSAAQAVAVLPSSVGAPGDLDVAFGGNGKVSTNISAAFDGVFDLAIQADQKIVGAGAGGNRFALARYGSDGTLDSSFGADGTVRTNFGPGADSAIAVAVQSDGRIVAAGAAGIEDNGGRFGVVRYNSDGTRDANFGTDGKVLTNFPGGRDHATGVAIQSDGNIVVAGIAGGGSDPKFAVARYDSEGSLDLSFSGNGKAVVNVTPLFDGAMDVALQADGKIVMVGIARGGLEGPGDSKFGVVRLNADGTRDTGFGGDGVVKTNFTGDFDVANSIAIQPDGQVLAAGSAGAERFAVARYTADGTLDSSFRGDGTVITDLRAGAIDIAEDVAVQSDDKIVVAGMSGERFALVRYDTDGTLDVSFSADGKVRTNFTPGFDAADALALQADGKIVIAGTAAGAKFALARYLP